jgi:hypothetical protein
MTAGRKTVGAAPGVAAAVVLALGASALCRSAAADEPLEYEKVPAVVKTALKHRFEKAENIACRIEGNDQDDAEYRFTFTLGGRRARANFGADGKFRESTESVKSADLPQAVRDAVQKRYPGVLVVMARKTVSGDGEGAKVTFRFRTQSEDERRLHIYRADGKLLEEKLEEDAESDENQ